MRKFAAASVLLSAAFMLTMSLALAQPEKTAAPTITYYGHSFFVVTSSKGTSIAFDPHLIPAYGRVQGIKADAILVSHFHNDHTQVTAIENQKDAKKIVGLTGGGFRTDWNIVDEKVKDVRIRSVGLYHDDMQGMKYGKVTAFIIEMDGWKIAHLGDTGHTLSREQLEQIGKVDVLMLPVGGIYTLNGSDAQKVVEQIRPREYIFPMHYATPVFDEILTEEEFLDGQPRERVARHDDNKIILNREPTRPRPLIVLLHYHPRAK